ncbi:MAG: glycosyltransferase family 2 protein [Ruminiclostridium sp.]|nr:glycosyltransferase family 2 protein [Ruminiclostridium sp.]
MGKRLDISYVMPCLNEKNTVGRCIDEAKAFIEKNALQGEVIVVDNGSNDGSVREALSHGARVIQESRRGYGRAIRTGILHTRGSVIVIGDCDSTYDFRRCGRFYFPLAEGKCDMMIGDRFSGGIEKGAMPPLHRLGVPFLSWCGRMKFGVKVRDFHCGLRSVTRSAAAKMRFRTTGMEFSTEFIAEGARNGLRIGQTPAKLRRCTEKRRSKLRTFPDGLRHLKYILSY